MATKSTRPIYAYTQAQLRKIERMAQLVREGYGGRRASEMADEELLLADGDRSHTVLPSAVPQLRDWVDGAELARLFEALCLRNGMAMVEINNTLRKWLSGQPDSEWRTAKDIIDKQEGDTELLLLDVLSNHKLDFVQVRNLAETFKIHVLLLDPLFSHAVEAEGVALSLNRDFVPIGDARDKRYGRGVQYKIPWKRLADTDAVLAFLDLPPQTKSDVHSHLGDEFLFVISGEVVIAFEDTEVSTTLGQGDYIHYYAEQTHAAANVTLNPAELFIVRFYQLRTEGTRQGIKRAVDDAVSEAPSLAGKTKIPPALVPWLRAMSSIPVPIGGVPTESEWSRKPNEQRPRLVKDTAGLGRFLEEVRVMRAHSSYKMVCDASGESAEYHRQLENGIAEVPCADLCNIAEWYGVQEMLLHNYICPAFPHVVAVRGLTSPSISKDFAAVAEQVTEGSSVKYGLPRRNLMYSDMSINLTMLKPNQATLANAHPGFEFVMPLEGVCKVVFESSGTVFRASAHERGYVHYSSEQLHRVVTESEPARVLVIRFYRDRRVPDGKEDRTKPRGAF